MLLSLFRKFTIRGYQNVRQTQDFILAIIEQPRLAHYVQYICVVDERDGSTECECREWVYDNEIMMPIPIGERHPLSPRNEYLFHKAIKAQKNIWSTAASQNLLLEVVSNSSCQRCGNCPLKYQFHDAAVAILEPLLRQQHTLELGSKWHPMTIELKPDFAFLQNVAEVQFSNLSLTELVLSDKCSEPFMGIKKEMCGYPAPMFFDYARNLTPYDLLRILHFAKVPSLRKISGRGIYCPEEPQTYGNPNCGKYIHQLLSFPPCFSNIIELDLRCSYLDDKVLQAICRLPKSLEVLRLSDSEDMEVIDERSAFRHLSLIGEILQKHTKSLRILELDIDKYVCTPMDSPNPLGYPDKELHCIGSFEDFHVLKVLAIGFLTLLVDVNSEKCWDNLYLKDYDDDDFDDENILHVVPTYTHPLQLAQAFPPSLEVLVIYDYEKEAVPIPAGFNAWFNYQSDQLTNLLEKRGELYPMLKTVRGINQHVHGRRVPSPLDELCEEVGMPMA